MRRLFAIIVAAIAFIGCSMDDITVSYQTDKSDIYYASFEDFGEESRTYVDENVKLLWHEDDRISLFRTTLNEQFKFTGATGDNSGGFALIESDEFVTGSDVSTNYAVYPYDATTKLSNDEIIQLTMPAVQHYAENSFGRGANTMVAASENKSSTFLPFRNLGGYIIVKLYGEDTTIKSIEFKGNNDEIIAGAATAEAKYGYLPVIAMSESGTTTITLDCGEEGVTISSDSANPTSFWFVVPPITFEGGFTFTITDINGNTFTKSTTKSQTVVRNEVKSMSGFEPTFEGEGEDPELATKPANNEIWYTATEKVEPYNTDEFGATYLTNVWDSETGKGVITFDGDVTKIGDCAFYGYLAGDYSLTSVTIPDSVTTIGVEAFYDCKSLTSVTIPDSVTTIGGVAFHGCESLTSVTIGNSVTTIGYRAFQYCINLTSVTIPDSVTTIEDDAFEGCTSLTSVTIGNGVATIGEDVFLGCSSLTAFYGEFTSYDNRCLIVNGVLKGFAPSGLSEYVIPGCVTTIGNSAFSLCTSLASVTIPDSVTTIGDMAFFKCYSLTSVTIGDSVTTIGDSAFCYCESLTSVTIPDSVTTMGDYAFYHCDSLTSVTIGDSVTTIGDYAFYYCESLTSVTIPDSVTTIGVEAFYHCDSLTSVTIGNSVTTIGDYAFCWCYSITNVTIGNSVTTIGDYAFANWYSLTSVTIPDSVTTIGNGAFCDCDSLTSVTIGNSVTTIGVEAFYHCDSLTSVTIPDSVTTIGEYAFSSCDNLTSVAIGNSVTTIGDYAFSSCNNLTSVTIPDSVTEIGYMAFSSCNNLTSVTIGNSVTTIGERAFADCKSLKEFKGKFAADGGRCLIMDNTIIAYANASGTTYTIPDSVTTIGDYAFYECSSLTSVTIPDSVTTIGDGAFYFCKSLTSVTIPDSVKTIGEGAFYNCSSLTSVTIPDSVTTIGNDAFCVCSSLATVYCKPTTPPTGGYDMFGSNASGRKIYVPMESVDAYKSASSWSEYADAIVGYDF